MRGSQHGGVGDLRGDYLRTQIIFVWVSVTQLLGAWITEAKFLYRSEFPIISYYSSIPDIYAIGGYSRLIIPLQLFTSESFNKSNVYSLWQTSLIYLRNRYIFIIFLCIFYYFCLFFYLHSILYK